MSLTRRFAQLVRVKAHNARNPGRPLSSPDVEAESVAAEHALAEVTAEAERLEREGRRLQAEAATLFELAMAERSAGRSDAAAEVLTRRAAIEPQLESLRAEHRRLEAEEARLRFLLSRLSH